MSLRSASFTVLLVGVVLSAPLRAQTMHTPQELLKVMIVNEDNALKTHDRYEYLSEERSDRTGGHLWTERVVETAQGRVRLLLSVDGVSLASARALAERTRLTALAADPTDFIRREQAQYHDEEHARHMLELLPVYFLFDNVGLQNGVWTMDFRTNPAASPSGVEDRVLHAMSGTVRIDAQSLRLLHIDGTLPTDLEIGYGLLANIRAGSRFASDRRLVNAHWRTVSTVTDIRGKAALFKAISRSSDLKRSEFQYLDHDVTVSEAVQLLLDAPPQQARP